MIGEDNGSRTQRTKNMTFGLNPVSREYPEKEFRLVKP
jgi:hypothetical protein